MIAIPHICKVLFKNTNRSNIDANQEGTGNFVNLHVCSHITTILLWLRMNLLFIILIPIVIMLY